MRFVHAVKVDVPTIPAHGRRQGQGVAADDLQRPLGLALLIFPAEHRAIFAFRGNRAADDARVGVERQAGGKSVGRELHRPLARGRNAVQERMVWTAGIDLGAVDLRRRARWRREQHGLFFCRRSYRGKEKKQ